MRVVVLSSGSKGNSTYIEIGCKRILIDVGNTRKYVCDSLLEIGVDPSLIDTILITHAHNDHIGGLRTFLNKYSPDVYMSKDTNSYLKDIINLHIIVDNVFMLDDVRVDVIKTSHDIKGSLGFVLSYQDESVVYITDTGYINMKYDELLKNSNVYIMESNHDVEMLQNGRYPFELKKRILGDKGHLSNYDASKNLIKYIGNNTKCVVLAHLSEENNEPSLALKTCLNKFKEKNIIFNNVIVAKQNIICEVFDSNRVMV